MDNNHKPTEGPLIDTALATLRQLGIEAEVERQQPKLGRAQADALIRVRHGDQEILYAANVKRGLRPAILGAVLQQFERLGVKGQRPTKHEAPRQMGRAFQARGLQVIFALLCRPEQVDRPYREIAKLAGVAHGTVGWVMGELPKLGFVAEVAHKRRLVQPERLLQQWVEAYARTLRPKLVLGRFKAEWLDWWETLDPLEYGLTMGGEGAGARLT